MSRNSTISVKALVLIGFLLSAAITYLYANSITVAYGGLELAMAAVCYVGVLLRYKHVDSRICLLTFAVVALTWLVGLFGGDLKSTLLITVPLLMPLYVGSLNITYKGWKDFVPVTLVAIVTTYLAVEQEFFGKVNPNTLGFLGFIGVSLGILWIKTAKRKVIPSVLVLFGFICAANSGSRNVAIVGLLCVILLFLPNAVLRNPVAYCIISLLVLGYSVFAEDILTWAFSKPKLYKMLVEFTSQYSGKAWEMTSRLVFLREMQNIIAGRDLLQKMFGTGTFIYNGHNLLYQCVLNFGYVGTALIYAMFLRLFQLAYVLIRRERDDVVLGCVVILWGTFLLQGADVFLLGHETYTVVPQVVIGIILNRYASYRKNDNVAVLNSGVMNTDVVFAQSQEDKILALK